MEATSNETLKTFRQKKPTKIEDMTKEQIRQALIKKRECNARAQNIVESLLESGISDKYFLECLPEINQTHFEDIIEERSIIHLCGYPLCSNTLSEKDIPKQKYRISVKTNKVYDITARKSFCSNSCYKAAMYVKKQMLTSPLWFREYEIIPSFHLMPLDTVGTMGQEVDLGLIQRVKLNPDNRFTTINEFAQASLTDISGYKEDILSKNVIEKNNVDETNSNLKESNNLVDGTTKQEIVLNSNSVINDNEEKRLEKCAQPDNIETLVETRIPKDKDTAMKEQKKAVPNPLNIVGEIVEKPEKKVDPILLNTPEQQKPNTPTQNKKKVPKNQPLVTVLIVEVEKCLAEWFTLDTLLFLFGDEKVREMVADKGDSIKGYLNNFTKGTFYNSNTYDQYQTLLRKLNMLELEDKKYDSQTLQRETKPLPDYKILQEESKRMQLKVKSFLTGDTTVPVLQAESTQIDSETDNFTTLPLVDKNSQNALRRRIVCQHLNKMLPDLLRSLGLLSMTISEDIRLLVNTLKLKANNIMFKPIQWTLIALIFIKLLSIRDKRLEYLLRQPIAFSHMQLLLLSYKQQGGYLERLIPWLTDVDRILNTDDVQLTKE